MIYTVQITKGYGGENYMSKQNQKDSPAKGPSQNIEVPSNYLGISHVEQSETSISFKKYSP